jgi:hypothetical protein
MSPSDKAVRQGVQNQTRRCPFKYFKASIDTCPMIYCTQSRSINSDDDGGMLVNERGKTNFMGLYNLKSDLYPSVAAASRLMDFRSAYPPAYAPAYGYLSRSPMLTLPAPPSKRRFSIERISTWTDQVLTWGNRIAKLAGIIDKLMDAAKHWSK